MQLPASPTYLTHNVAGLAAKEQRAGI